MRLRRWKWFETQERRCSGHERLRPQCHLGFFFFPISREKPPGKAGGKERKIGEARQRENMLIRLFPGASRHWLTPLPITLNSSRLFHTHNPISAPAATILLLPSRLLRHLARSWQRKALFSDVSPLTQSVACIITHAAVLTHFSVTEAPVGVHPPSFAGL